jgi:hypothetical protein
VFYSANETEEHYLFHSTFARCKHCIGGKSAGKRTLHIQHSNVVRDLASHSLTAGPRVLHDSEYGYVGKVRNSNVIDHKRTFGSRSIS